MPFFNQHLEFKVDFDTNFNIGLSNLRPVLNDLFQKFYTYITPAMSFIF